MPGSANSLALVSADWAQEHLDDPTLRFVEVDVDTESYRQGHIPGAAGWNWETQLCDRIRRDIVGSEALSELLSSSDIGLDTQVLLYGHNNNWFAAWAYWQLRLQGVERLSLIDGDRAYWLANVLLTTTEVPEYALTGSALAEPDFATRAFQRDIADQRGDPSLALVGVRRRPSSAARCWRLPA